MSYPTGEVKECPSCGRVISVFCDNCYIWVKCSCGYYEKVALD